MEAQVITQIVRCCPPGLRGKHGCRARSGKCLREMFISINGVCLRKAQVLTQYSRPPICELSALSRRSAHFLGDGEWLIFVIGGVD